MSLSIYDVARVRSLKTEHFDDTGKWFASFTYRAEKKRSFVVLLIGEVADDEPIDPDAMLRAAGWVPAESDAARRRTD